MLMYVKSALFYFAGDNIIPRTLRGLTVPVGNYRLPVTGFRFAVMKGVRNTITLDRETPGIDRQPELDLH